MVIELNGVQFSLKSNDYKLHDRVAGLQFVNHKFDFRPKLHYTQLEPAMTSPTKVWCSTNWVVVCIAQRKRTPVHVTVQAPTGTQTTTVQGIQNPAATTCQYPQQTQGGFVPPPNVGYSSAPQSSYPPPSTGYPQPPQGSYQYPPSGSYPMSTTGGGTSAPGYPPQSSVPMMPYPQQAIPNDPPPAYPGPPAYPPQGFTGQPAPSNPNQSYPPPQAAETQQSSPPYPPAQDTIQATAPPPF